MGKGNIPCNGKPEARTAPSATLKWFEQLSACGFIQPRPVIGNINSTTPCAPDRNLYMSCASFFGIIQKVEYQSEKLISVNAQIIGAIILHIQLELTAAFINQCPHAHLINVHIIWSVYIG